MKSPNPTSVRLSSLLSLLSQPISTIPRDKPLRMPEPSLDSTSSESSTSQPLLPLPTVSIDNLSKRRTSSSSILVVVLSMSPSLPSRKVSSRLRLPTVTPTWVVRISITSLSTSALLTSRRSLELTSREMPELLEDLELNARRLREFSHLHIRPQLSARPLLRVRITTPTSQEPSLKSFAWTFSDSACHQSNPSSRMLKSPRTRFTKSYLSVDPLESPRSNKCFPISSTERFLTNPSIQMRPSLMVLLSRLPSLLDKVMRRPLSFFSSMLPHLLWVSRLLVV